MVGDRTDAQWEAIQPLLPPQWEVYWAFVVLAFILIGLERILK